jgi:hypothetical protein
MAKCAIVCVFFPQQVLVCGLITITCNLQDNCIMVIYTQYGLYFRCVYNLYHSSISLLLRNLLSCSLCCKLITFCMSYTVPLVLPLVNSVVLPLVNIIVLPLVNTNIC